jgi:predicted phosphodiesterase
MLTAIMADIHANREAFEACLRHARAAGVERHVLLGDIVGYGPDPEWACETAERLAQDGALIVRGNHDDAAVTGDVSEMSGNAAAAITWTRPLLGAHHRAFLDTLPLTIAEPDRLYVHANAWAPADWDYVTSDVTAERSLRYAKERISFIGHVHVAALYTQTPGRPCHRHHPTPGLAIPLLSSRRWLVTVGAVGQPRDGNPAAGYCLHDSRRGEITRRPPARSRRQACPPSSRSG